jgi:hypothetical protein
MYHKNLTSALIHLKHMKRNTKAPFFSGSRPAEDVELWRRDIKNLNSLYEKLELILLRTASELATTDLTIPPGLPLTVLLAQVLTTPSLTDTCPICEPPSQASIMDVLSQEDEFYSELQARQYRLVKHLKTSDPHDVNDLLLQREVDRYAELSAMFPRRAHERLKSLGMLETAAVYPSLRIYHPDAIGSYTFQLGEEQEDCLFRTSLHSWLDHTAPNRHPADLEQLELESRDWMTVNETDILGRTPLHIACQHGWIEGVKALLKLGADTSTTTIYGSTPLHYAAVRGSLEICVELLNEGMEYGNIQLFALDCEGYTAMHYALKNGHSSMAKTLANYGSSQAGKLHQTIQGLERPDNNAAKDSSSDAIRPKDPTPSHAPSDDLVVNSNPQSLVPRSVFANDEVYRKHGSVLDHPVDQSHTQGSTFVTTYSWRKEG